MKLSEMIKGFREENGISQREFARRCGLSNSLISLLEKGINPQTGNAMSQDIDTYIKLARGMQTSLQKLFEDLGDDAIVKLDINQDPRFDLTAASYAEGMKDAVGYHLSAEECDIIRGYRAVKPGIKDAVRKLLNIPY